MTKNDKFWMRFVWFGWGIALGIQIGSFIADHRPEKQSTEQVESAD